MKTSTIIIIVFVLLIIIAIGGTIAYFWFSNSSTKKEVTPKNETFDVRYVRLLASPKQTAMNVAELEVYDINGNNVALHKPVTASSLHLGKLDHAIGLTDGLTDGNFNDTFAHTSNQEVGTEVWFEVDLQQTYKIKEIKIYNRTDCCWDRLDNMLVLLYDENRNLVKTIDTELWLESDIVKTFVL